MARIKCKNCGKAYRYETEGCCPECGAYNRPPRREKVNADGSVYHINDANYLENRYEQAKVQRGKVCFEEKECHEEKVCYEEQAKPRKAVTITPMLNQTDKRSGRKQSKKPASIIAVVIAVIAAIVGPISQLVADHTPDYPAPDPITQLDVEVYISQFNVQDGMATVVLEDADAVEDGILFYFNEENEFCSADVDACNFFGSQCVMTFLIESSFGELDSVDVLYDGEWVELYI